jgi:hypothetical protein
MTFAVCGHLVMDEDDYQSFRALFNAEHIIKEATETKP